MHADNLATKHTHTKKTIAFMQQHLVGGKKNLDEYLDSLQASDQNFPMI